MHLMRARSSSIDSHSQPRARSGPPRETVFDCGNTLVSAVDGMHSAVRSAFIDLILRLGCGILDAGHALWP